MEMFGHFYGRNFFTNIYRLPFNSRIMNFLFYASVTFFIGINKLAPVAVGLVCWLRPKPQPGDDNPLVWPTTGAPLCRPPFCIGITPTFKLIVGIWPTGMDALPSGLLAGGWACDNAPMLCDWWPRKDLSDIGVNIAAACG